MPTESSPASRTMPTEIIPELLVLPVMASAAILKQSAVIVPSMDNTEAVPKQPAFTATGSKSAPVLQTLDSAFESASVPDPTLPSRFNPELFPIVDCAPVPKSLESTQEFISEQVQEQPENIPESVSEPVPVQKQSVSRSPNRSSQDVSQSHSHRSHPLSLLVLSWTRRLSPALLLNHQNSPPFL